MDEEVKKDAEEEMNCILDLLEEWCLKYDQDYANAVVLVKHVVKRYIRTHNIQRSCSKRTMDLPGNGLCRS